ncbi:MAG: molybdate ABC transporter substrate-binding protein [Verrucomicrobia bacterium]|nr:molybdate ABC transporter substrate-binding protein [Verrucomicrobiota bacterium]
MLCLSLLLAVAPELRAAGLLVSAAASLTDVMKEVAEKFEQQTGEKVVLNFGASSMLARQIEESAPADIFISADEAQMDRLDKAHLIDHSTRFDLLTNRLVVVARPGVAVHTLADLEKLDRIVLADPRSVPAGVYAKAVVTAAGLWEKLQAKIVPAENVRAALAIVQSGNADAGFVYATDARSAPGLSVALSISPDRSPRIVYPAAIIIRSAHPEEAKRFLAFIRQEQEVFQRAGFGIAH